MNILEVRDLSTYYDTKSGYNEALQGISLNLKSGEILGLIGESGCGKSTAAFSIMNMIEYPGKIMSGDVKLSDINLLKISRSELRNILWKEISMIPQSAMNSLNPSYKIGSQILEVVKIHFPELSKNEGKEKVEKLLVSVGIDPKWYNAYPHKLSGGMKQRVIIAMALACNPKVIISDESTTGLDVLIEAQIISLLKKLKDENGLGIIIISHDLHMVTSVCDRIGIMYAGNLVEIASTYEIQNNPRHPYTKALFSSQIDVGDFNKKVESIEGIVPKLINPEDRCRFYSRCTKKIKTCDGISPELVEISDGHEVACYLEVEAHE